MSTNKQVTSGLLAKKYNLTSVKPNRVKEEEIAFLNLLYSEFFYISTMIFRIVRFSREIPNNSNQTYVLIASQTI